MIYFAVPFLMHSTVIDNPNAMLPTERWDRAGMKLAFGFVPLLIANTLGFLFVKFGTKKKRALFFIPSLIDSLLVIGYFIVSV